MFFPSFNYEHNVAVNTGVRISLRQHAFHSFATYAEVELLCTNVVAKFFEEVPYGFPQWLYCVTHPPALHRGSIRPHVLATPNLCVNITMSRKVVPMLEHNSKPQESKNIEG